MVKPLCLLLTLLGLTGCRSRTPPASRLTLPEPDAQGAYHLTSDALFDLYRIDGKQADQLLRGKSVIVTGWVVRELTRVEVDKERAKQGELTNPDLYLHVDHQSNGFFVSSEGVICNFPSSAREALRARVKKLAPREKVTVRGVVDGKLGSVFLKDCALVTAH